MKTTKNLMLTELNLMTDPENTNSPSEEQQTIKHDLWKHIGNERRSPPHWTVWNEKKKKEDENTPKKNGHFDLNIIFDKTWNDRIWNTPNHKKNLKGVRSQNPKWKKTHLKKETLYWHSIFPRRKERNSVENFNWNENIPLLMTQNNNRTKGWKRSWTNRTYSRWTLQKPPWKRMKNGSKGKMTRRNRNNGLSPLERPKDWKKWWEKRKQ